MFICGRKWWRHLRLCYWCITEILYKKKTKIFFIHEVSFFVIERILFFFQFNISWARFRPVSSFTIASILRSYFFSLLHSIGYRCFHIWKSNFHILCCLRMIRILLIFRIICFCSKTHWVHAELKTARAHIHISLLRVGYVSRIGNWSFLTLNFSFVLRTFLILQLSQERLG